MSYRVKSERENQISYNNAYMWDLENGIGACKPEIETQTLRTNVWIARGKGVGWEEVGDWD